MRSVMMAGACSACLLGLGAPAAAVEPNAAPASGGSWIGTADSAANPDVPGDTSSGESARVLIMTLSKPQREPEPRTASEPGELRKRALSRRPPRLSD